MWLYVFSASTLPTVHVYYMHVQPYVCSCCTLQDRPLPKRVRFYFLVWQKNGQTRVWRGAKSSCLNVCVLSVFLDTFYTQMRVGTSNENVSDGSEEDLLEILNYERASQYATLCCLRFKKKKSMPSICSFKELCLACVIHVGEGGEG